MGLPFGRSKTTSCPKLQDRWKEGRHLLGAVGFQGLNRVPSHVFFFAFGGILGLSGNFSFHFGL